MVQALNPSLCDTPRSVDAQFANLHLLICEMGVVIPVGFTSYDRGRGLWLDSVCE